MKTSSLNEGIHFLKQCILRVLHSSLIGNYPNNVHKEGN